MHHNLRIICIIAHSWLALGIKNGKKVGRPQDKKSKKREMQKIQGFSGKLSSEADRLFGEI